MDLFEIVVTEEALAHEVDAADVGRGQGDQFVAEEYCVRVVVHV